MKYWYEPINDTGNGIVFFIENAEDDYYKQKKAAPRRYDSYGAPQI